MKTRSEAWLARAGWTVCGWAGRSALQKSAWPGFSTGSGTCPAAPEMRLVLEGDGLHPALASTGQSSFLGLRFVSKTVS